MLDELRLGRARQRANHLRGLVAGCRRLLSERGEANSVAIAAFSSWRTSRRCPKSSRRLLRSPGARFQPRPASGAAERAGLRRRARARPTCAPDPGSPSRRDRSCCGASTARPAAPRASSRCAARCSQRLPRAARTAGARGRLAAPAVELGSTPASCSCSASTGTRPRKLLEQIIQHEAVHQIDGWDDLRRRLQPDRRCFAFFHPQLPRRAADLRRGGAAAARCRSAIAPLIDKASTPLAAEQFKVAAFYSISNCQPGLRGVSLGNFLIKRVAEELQRELPQLKTFCTLSPMPGLRAPGCAAGRRAKACRSRAARAADARPRATLLASLRRRTRPPAARGRAAASWARNAGRAAALCSAYLCFSRPRRGGDPVARFHLDNGARLERLNALGDLSAKGAEAVLRHDGQLPLRSGQDRSQPREVPQGEVAHSRAVHTADEARPTAQRTTWRQHEDFSRSFDPRAALLLGRRRGAGQPAARGAELPGRPSR